MMSNRDIPRWARLVVQSTTTLLLSTSILLTLLILLTPTSNVNLSMFTIKPMGQDRVLVQSGPTAEPTFRIISTNATGTNTRGDSRNHPDPTTSAVVAGMDMTDIKGRQVKTSVGLGESDRPSYPHHAPITPGSNITGIAAGGMGDKEGLMMYWWLGTHGPSIHVGVMQICSKATAEEEISCTSASRGSYHAAFLPYTLGDPLVQLPTAPPAPVLLLVGGTCALMATILYLWSIFIATSFAQRCRVMKDKANVFSRYPNVRKHTRQPSVGSISSLNSATTLVNPAPPTSTEKEGKHCLKGPHLAFLVLSVMAFGLATAAMVVEMVIVSKAKTRWDEAEAGGVGMKFELGVLTYLLPCLPIILLLAILTAYSPSFYTRLKRRQGIAANGTEDVETASVNRSMIETKDISAPKHIETTRIPEEWTRVSLDRPSRPPTVVPPLASNTLAPGKRQSARRSWRNTFSSTVGMAV